MKTRTVLLGAALVLLLASCFSPLSSEGGTGSITISVPSLEQAGVSSSKLSASAAGDNNYFARAFIYRDGSEVAFGEVNVSSDKPSELTIAGIPEGDGYELVVTIGTKDGGALFPEKFGESEGEFSITGGRNSGVSVAMEDSPFFYAKVGNEALSDLKGVAVDSNSAFVTASSSTVYAIGFSAIDGSRFVGPTVNEQAGFRVNALNQGVIPIGNELIAWAAGPGSKIVPFDLSQGNFNNLGNVVPPDYIEDEGAKNILSSYGYAEIIDGVPTAVAMFQIDGGLGGGQANEDGDTWGDTGEDLKEFVSGQPVLTIDVWDGSNGTSALFATKIGAFAVTQEIFGSLDQEALTEAFLTGKARPGLIPITLVQGGQTRRITSMSAGLVGDTGRVFLGSARGVFMTNGSRISDAEENEEAARISVDAGHARVVPGTQGLQVADLEFMRTSDGTEYLVTLTRSDLVVTNLFTGKWATVPNVAGVPGIPAVGRSVSGVKGMSLVETGEGGAVYLAMAGDFGFAALDVEELSYSK